MQPIILPADTITSVPYYNMASYDQQIEAFYQSGITPQKKLQAAAALFLDAPYVFEPLGEGYDGKYNHEPLYRTDTFDCVTYVNTILALTNAANLSEFQENMLRIRYINGIMDYTRRTDWFTDLEWIPNAEQLGWMRDITHHVLDSTQNPVACIAQTIIEKPNWYAVKTLRTLHLSQSVTPQEANKLLIDLRKEGMRFRNQESQISYIPIEILFDSNSNPINSLFDQIPSGCFIAFVMPNWTIRDTFKDYPNGYGTNLNVRHVGILLRNDNELMLYHASAIDRKVISLPLADYLKSQWHNDTVKGFHIEKIMVD